MWIFGSLKFVQRIVWIGAPFSSPLSCPRFSSLRDGGRPGAPHYAHLTRRARLTAAQITEVHVDALAALRIIKHCRESLPSTVTGQIQGVDNDGILQITNSFPFTASAGPDEVDAGEVDVDDMDGSQYQVSMLKRLRQMNYDVNTCGWYRTADPALFEAGVVEDQFTYQQTFPHSVVLVYDPSRQGNLALVAYRLTPKFMQMRAAAPSGRFTMEGLLTNKLTFSKVFQAVPVKIHNTSFASALIQQLMYDNGLPDESKLSMPSPTFASLLEETAGLSPNYDNLELNFDNYLEQRLENMIQEVCLAGQSTFGRVAYRTTRSTGGEPGSGHVPMDRMAAQR